LALDEPNAEDEIFNQESFQVIVNSDELKNIGNVEIDFRESGYGSGFSVRSAVSSSC